MTMSPEKKDYGHHSYPLERIETAVQFLKKSGYERIGIVGLSTTGMVALAAASFIPDITITVALSPSDFIMEGFYQDNKDGMHERPGENESALTWRGKQLPYLPYAYRHPDYFIHSLTHSMKFVVESPVRSACVWPAPHTVSKSTSSTPL